MKLIENLLIALFCFWAAQVIAVSIVFIVPMLRRREKGVKDG